LSLLVGPLSQFRAARKPAEAIAEPGEARNGTKQPRWKSSLNDRGPLLPGAHNRIHSTSAKTRTRC